MSASKFHNHTEQQAKWLHFVVTDDTVISQRLDIGEMEGDATVFSQSAVFKSRKVSRYWIVHKMFIKLFTVCGEEIDYVEQGPALEANSSSASQEISSILWNPKFRYRVCNSLPSSPSPGSDQSSPRPGILFLAYFSISSLYA
jgi:hypothetical protein